MPLHPKKTSCMSTLFMSTQTIIYRQGCRTVGGNNVRIEGLIVSLIEHHLIAIWQWMQSLKKHACKKTFRQTPQYGKQAAEDSIYSPACACACQSYVIQVHAQHRHSEWLTVADRRNWSPLAHGIGPRVNAQYPCHNHHQHSSNQAALGTTQSHAQATALHGCKTITIPSHRHEQEAGLHQLIYLHWSAIQAGTITGQYK